jgi:ArsR family transcriptional regulator, arsenate/arsenite/antimonite-responsive transcriptional repressor
LIYVDIYASIDLCQYESMRTLGAIDDCCPALLGNPLDRDDAAVLAGAFKVLGDPARLRLLSLISASPGGEACVCELIGPLGLSQPTVSHHLKALHRSGLVAREKRGTWAFYRVIPSRLSALRDALAGADRG